MDRGENQQQLPGAWNKILSLVKSNLAFQTLKSIPVGSGDDGDDREISLANGTRTNGAKYNGVSKQSTEVKVQREGNPIKVISEAGHGTTIPVNGPKAIPGNEELPITRVHTKTLDQSNIDSKSEEFINIKKTSMREVSINDSTALGVYNGIPPPPPFKFS